MQKAERVDEFVSLYTQHSLRVRGFVRSLVPTQPDADDVFQEVSRTLWAKFHEYQSGTNFVAWALSIARYHVMYYRRTKMRLPTSMSDAAFAVIADDLMDSAGCDDMQLQYLNDCLRRLPERDRELIRARYRQGESTKSLAAMFNRSIDAIYRSMRRIHKSLLVCLERRIADEG